MTPLGHAAVALLTARARGDPVRPAAWTTAPTAWVLAGAALPDPVDKPLVALGVVPVAHSVGHSVVVLALATLLARGVAGDGRDRATPFLLGWAGHVAADLVVAYPRFLANYAWPLLAPVPTPDDPWLAYWLEYAAGPLGALELLLAAAAAVAVARDRSRGRGRDRERERAAAREEGGPAGREG